jgi:hypothetical protein
LVAARSPQVHTETKEIGRRAKAAKLVCDNSIFDDLEFLNFCKKRFCDFDSLLIVTRPWGSRAICPLCVTLPLLSYVKVVVLKPFAVCVTASG